MNEKLRKERDLISSLKPQTLKMRAHFPLQAARWRSQVHSTAIKKKIWQREKKWRPPTGKKANISRKKKFPEMTDLMESYRRKLSLSENLITISRKLDLLLISQKRQRVRFMHYDTVLAMWSS